VGGGGCGVFILAGRMGFFLLFVLGPEIFWQYQHAFGEGRLWSGSVVPCVGVWRLWDCRGRGLFLGTDVFFFFVFFLQHVFWFIGCFLFCGIFFRFFLGRSAFLFWGSLYSIWDRDHNGFDVGVWLRKTWGVGFGSGTCFFFFFLACLLFVILTVFAVTLRSFFLLVGLELFYIWARLGFFYYLFLGRGTMIGCRGFSRRSSGVFGCTGVGSDFGNSRARCARIGERGTLWVFLGGGMGGFFFFCSGWLFVFFCL